MGGEHVSRDPISSEPFRPLSVGNDCDYESDYYCSEDKNPVL